MNNCSCCFTDFIAQCPDGVRVYAQLQPSTMYTWVITDFSGAQWSGDFTSDSDGFFTIPIDELPPGLLNQYHGKFELTVLDQGCKPIKFKVAQEYTCIEFKVVGGTRVKNTLGCPFDSVFTGVTFASHVVDTFADAQALAQGNQFLYIQVLNDEDKQEQNTSYFYVPGATELQYIVAVPNSET